MPDGGDAAHLDEAVRPDLLLSDERRIARIDRDRWIGYGRARAAIEELAHPPGSRAHGSDAGRPPLQS